MRIEMALMAGLIGIFVVFVAAGLSAKLHRRRVLEAYRAAEEGKTPAEAQKPSVALAA